MVAIYMILKQLAQKKPALENEYVRAVRKEGNMKAQLVVKETCETVDDKWRGLGLISCSKLKIKEKYAEYDAHRKYGLSIENSVDLQPGCRCHLIVIGRIKPTECPLFMKKCTPEKPVGACMVSSEGTCRIWAKTINTIGSQ
jgi:hydrogenase expression/formation protein HypD